MTCCINQRFTYLLASQHKKISLKQSAQHKVYLASRTLEGTLKLFSKLLSALSMSASISCTSHHNGRWTQPRHGILVYQSLINDTPPAALHYVLVM